MATTTTGGRPAALVAIDSRPHPTRPRGGRVGKLIRFIADRYATLTLRSGTDDGLGYGTLAECAENLLATVNRRQGLRLDRLAAFDDFNLMHDVVGLFCHARADGTLADCFSPRCGTWAAQRRREAQAVRGGAR